MQNDECKMDECRGRETLRSFVAAKGLRSRGFIQSSFSCIRNTEDRPNPSKSDLWRKTYRARVLKSGNRHRQGRLGVSKNMKITKRSHRFLINIGNFDFGFDKNRAESHQIKLNPTKKRGSGLACGTRRSG